MLKLTFKKGQNDITCRICKTTEETQHHILEECQGLHSDESTKVAKLDIFNDEMPRLTECKKHTDNYAQT